MLKITNILDKLYKVFQLKNAAYGNSFMNSLKKFGLIAAIVRISDKIERINTLINNPTLDTNNESLQDSYEDLINYCIMTLVYLDYGYLDSNAFIIQYKNIQEKVIDNYAECYDSNENIKENLNLKEIFDLQLNLPPNDYKLHRFFLNFISSTLINLKLMDTEKL